MKILLDKLSIGKQKKNSSGLGAGCPRALMRHGAAVDWFRPDEQEFKLGLSIVAYLLSMAQIWRMLDMRPTSAQGPSAPDINQQLTHLQNQLNERLS